MKLSSLLIAAISLFVFEGTPTFAATAINESFSAAASGQTVPAGWFSANSGVSAMVSLGGVKYMRIGANTVAGSDAVYYTATNGEVQNGQIRDFNAQIVMRMGGTFPQDQSLRGVVVRAQTTDLSAPAGSTSFWGYSIGVVATGSDKGLYIYENPKGIYWNGNSLDRGTQLAFQAFTLDLQSNVEYSFRISALGSILTASLWTLDGAQELASVTYSEAQIVSGYFGLRSANANAAANTSFRDLQMNVTAVPEPSGMFWEQWGSASSRGDCAPLFLPKSLPSSSWRAFVPTLPRAWLLRRTLPSEPESSSLLLRRVLVWRHLLNVKKQKSWLVP